MTLILLFFTALGLIFGSFTNALVRRIHEGKKISEGRSECPKCKHKLNILDLIPFFSWVFLRGKCRYCGEKIGIRYPLVEIFFGFFFFLTTFFLFPENFFSSYENFFLNGGNFFDNLKNFSEIFKFFLTLFLVGNFLILAIYDILYLEIIDGIAIWIGFLVLGLSFTDFGFVNFQDGLIGFLIIYTFFYLQILIPGIIFFLGNGFPPSREGQRAWKEKFFGIGKIFSSYFIFPIWMFCRLFFSEKFLEKFKIFSDEQKNLKGENYEIPAWIGGGDLRFALVMGFILGWQKSILALFVSYLLGGIYSIGFLIFEKISGKQNSHEIPFLPFLTIGTFIVLVFGDRILEFYFKEFLYF